MHRTGNTYNTISGSFDAAKGDFRLINVSAGATRFVDFKKVPKLIERFCQEIANTLPGINDENDALITSFDAHYNLVTIHPFADGNGRISRLLMNYIQHYFNLPLSNVFKEDKAAYYQSLVDSRKAEDLTPFRIFMLQQHKKMLEIEIEKQNTPTISSGF